jgi:hypothetical protein
MRHPGPALAQPAAVPARPPFTAPFTFLPPAGARDLAALGTAAFTTSLPPRAVDAYFLFSGAML